MFFRFWSACLPQTLLGLAPTTAIDFGRKTGSSVSVVLDSDVFCKIVDLLDGGGCGGKSSGGAGVGLAENGDEVCGPDEELDPGADLEAETVLDGQVRQQATGARDLAGDLHGAPDVERLGDRGLDVQGLRGAAAKLDRLRGDDDPDVAGAGEIAAACRLDVLAETAHADVAVWALSGQLRREEVVAPEEAGHEPGRRHREEIVWRAHRVDEALVHDRDTVGEGHRLF